MNKQQTLQNIWAMTDKRVIDMMAKKGCPPSTMSPNDSSDDSSDLESIDSRYGPFAAVPKEFRPPLSIPTNIEYRQISLNENKQMLSNQNQTSVTKTSTQKTVPKAPLLPNPKPPILKNSKPSHLPNPKPPLSINSKQPLFSNSDPPLLPNTKPAYMECRISNPSDPLVLKKNINCSKQKCHPVTNDTNMALKSTTVKDNSGANWKQSFQPPKKEPNNSLQKRNEVFSMEGPKHEISKNGIKYEYLSKEDHRTVKLNFEMPSHLQKGKEEIKWRHKNFCDSVEQKFSKNAHTVVCQENTVKWVSSFNSGEENSNEGKTERTFGKVTQENVVKWNSSLYRDQNNDTKGKTVKDFGKIKWHSSSNLKYSSSDSEGEIQYTVIKEKKTIISAKKIESKGYIHKKTRNKCLHTKTCTGNESKKPEKHQHKRYFNKNKMQPKNYHRKNTPKPECRDNENPDYKKDLQLNNNLKYDHNEIRNSDTWNKCSLDAETFTRQNSVKECNLESSKDNPSLSNDKTEFTINANTRKSIGNGEPNFYPEKTDNITLKQIEEQKASMLNYGREIADFIIGSHSALSIFISMFKEWKQSRIELIDHFQYIATNLKESSKKFTKYTDILDFAKNGAVLAAAVPLPHVSVAARVISVLASVFSVFLKSTEEKKAEIENSNDMSIAATRDTSASHELYMYGLQCGQNFEDTAKLIEDFHSNVADLEKEIFEKNSPEIATFIRGVLEYRPRHRIFYKKLHRCFQELLQNCTSEFGKRFCEPFLLNSTGTIDVVEFLNWRFRHEDFNGESVRFELEQIELLFQGKDTTIKELSERIQTCVGILQDELKFLEGCIKDFNLFDKSKQF